MHHFAETVSEIRCGCRIALGLLKRTPQVGGRGGPALEFIFLDVKWYFLRHVYVLNKVYNLAKNTRLC